MEKISTVSAKSEREREQKSKAAHHGPERRPYPRPTCPIHTDTELQCPRCIAARGGRRTAELHRHKLRVWGRRGAEETQRKRANKAA
jgi:hypothetical protein